MHKYEHRKLVDRLLGIDVAPRDNEAFAIWIEAKAHVDFLIDNAVAEEFVAHANGPFAFIHCALVPLDRLSPLNTDDLVGWNFSSSGYRSCYLSGGVGNDVWVEHGFSDHGSKTLKSGQHLIFRRTFEGWSGEDRSYFELLQEFSHLADIRWRPERRAYCKINEEGDVAPIVSITQRGEGLDSISLVSVARGELDQFLAASRLGIARMFDFTLLRRGHFSDHGDDPEEVHSRGGDLHYRQKIAPGHAAYTRGFQVVYPIQGYEATRQAIRESGFGSTPEGYVEFITRDWRNDRICKISTDPAATTNYFEAKDNKLPYELSPAFFKPEVLSKYKADRDKYTVGTRDIHCRTAWTLRGYDINEAGQVHAYICDLRNLPYSEQLHWQAHNEAPKTSISDRAFTTDFEGDWTEQVDSLDRVKSRLRKWQEMDLTWWRPTAKSVFTNVTMPHTESRDEWSNAFLDLSQLIIEGFQTRAIRRVLDQKCIVYENSDQSIKLLEHLWEHVEPKVSGKFSALRSVQHIRSKTRGHSGSSKAERLANDALREHGSYGHHFGYVCKDVDRELERIFNLFA